MMIVASDDDDAMWSNVSNDNEKNLDKPHLVSASCRVTLILLRSAEMPTAAINY